MKNVGTLFTAAMLLAATSAAAGEQLAAREVMPVKSVSSIVQKIETRSDFASESSIRYNAQARTYVVSYTTTDGDLKMLILDAVTGEERG